MTQCFVALGSNLNQPMEQVEKAVIALSKLPNSSLVAVSRWYESVPIGPEDQPNYINGVAELDTRLTPLLLLDELQRIELDHHRERLVRWGPRTLDLDILLYGKEILNLPRLVIPHPHMFERNFVLHPLNDIAPNLILPDGRTLTEKLQQCTNTGLGLVDPTSSPTIASTQLNHPE